MTIARHQQVNLDATPYYHCISRCVRRAFLCGNDPFSGKNYNHRKGWIIDQIKRLSEVFAIDICSYSILDNHYHLVLRVNREQAEAWTEREVIERWLALYQSPLIIERFTQGEILGPAELSAVSDIITQWRTRLQDISWLMRGLNEKIARLANAEDQCKGRFWEGRFKSQALLDESAILACMMYVDLNPIRAGLARSLDQSDYTSIQQRIQEQQSRENKANNLPALLPFALPGQGMDTFIPFQLNDYLQLIDWTGRGIREDKKGAIPEHIQPILDQLNINPHEWTTTVQHFGRCFFHVVGPIEAMRTWGRRINQLWLHGLSGSKRFYRLAT
jgi:REP element-mobilizing transposase RayT